MYKRIRTVWLYISIAVQGMCISLWTYGHIYRVVYNLLFG